MTDKSKEKVPASDGAENKRPRKRVAKRKKKKGSNTFEWFLFVSALVIACLGFYEMASQRFTPGSSILNAAHSKGHLTDYPVIYEAGDGIWHPLGWVGSGMMCLMMLYSVRKRFKIFRNFGSLRHWLSAHMFLGIVGPLLVTLHTTFRLHGIIATSFWCMIVTVLFGIMGRYIYVQIPHSINGAELADRDIDDLVNELDEELGLLHLTEDNMSTLLEKYLLPADEEEERKETNPFKVLLYMLRSDIGSRFTSTSVKRFLKKGVKVSWKDRRTIAAIINKKAALLRRKNFLKTTQSLLHYWHVLHIPLAAVMFLIMFLHIAVYYIFSPSSL